MGVLESIASDIQYYLDPYVVMNKPCEQRNTALALNLKMQAILFMRAGIGNSLPDLKEGWRSRREEALKMLNALVPIPEILVTHYTYEVVDDGWSYYDFSGRGEEFGRMATLSSLLSEFSEWLDRQELEDALECEYYDCADMPTEDILDTYDSICKDSQNPALISFLEWVSDVGFEGEVDPVALSRDWRYFVMNFAPGGYPRLVNSYLIKGLDLDDEELQDEIREIGNPLSTWIAEPMLMQVGKDVLLSYSIPSEDCYTLNEELERPLWRLAMKRIEEVLLKRQGEVA